MSDYNKTGKKVKCINSELNNLTYNGIYEVLVDDIDRSEFILDDVDEIRYVGKDTFDWHGWYELVEDINLEKE